MSQDSLEEFANHKLRSLERRSLQRTIADTDRSAAPIVKRDGRRLVSFSCNDYLGLATDPGMIEAAIAATRASGTGAGAPRLTTGSFTGYKTLESKLAKLKDTADAVVFGSGYLANVGIIPVFAGKPDLILIDELAHSSMLTGASLSGATVVHFAHNDPDALAQALTRKRTQYRHCLILTEGVFSMDGDLAPLPEFAQLAADHNAWLMTDDAHGLGVVGGGRGSGFAFNTRPRVPLQMGTLSKAVGAYGGYLCASTAVCALVRNRARSFVYSTALPPGTVAAALQGLETITSDPARVTRPLALARRFADALGLAPAESAIVPLVLGNNSTALAASDALADAGFLVTAIRPPTVPTGTARLRFTFSAQHTDEQISALIEAVRRLDLPRR